MVLGGNRVAWPVYMSIRNIHSSIRTKISNQAFILVAYLPVVKFGYPKAVEGVLRDRFFHQCMRIVLQSVRKAQLDGVEMTDSFGHVRLCVPLLTTHICDLPEKHLVAVTSHSNSSTFEINKKDFGTSKTHQLRSRVTIERLLKKAEKAQSRRFRNTSSTPRVLGSMA